MGWRKKKQPAESKPRNETPVERATREYYENASEEALGEENALGSALAQTASEIDFENQD